ncbi:MAG: ATP-binding protein [Chloroflexota bacterium]|jgi:PAS domain S-box-containing protein
MTAQLDVSALLTLIINSAVDLLVGNAGVIALRDESGELHIHAAAHIPQSQWSAFNTLVSRYNTNPNHVFSHEDLIDTRHLLPITLRQMTALAMTYHGTQIGVIFVFRAAVNVAFNNDEHVLLSAFANQAAIAVTNARLFQSLIREKQHLAAIVEQSIDGVMILDGRWRITAFNRAMELLTGWERSEASGRPCAEVVGIQTTTGDNLCRIDCPLQRPHIGNVVQAEGWITARDGRRRYIQNTYTIQRDTHGVMLGAIANVRDITQQKIESEMQNTFISVISHELKTPVSIIRGYAEILSRPDMQLQTDQVHSFGQIIIEEADRLTHEINSLLEVSRIQLNAIPLEITQWPFAPLIDQVTNRFHGQAQQQGITFDIRIPSDLPDIQADRERTRLVCENLITNAIKYSPDGGLVRIQARSDNGLAIISVTDHGIGIPLEEQSRVFDRFYRVDNRLRRETQGFGLGLFLAKMIVEAQHGQIWVESRPNNGSRFSFSLPLAIAQVKGESIDDEAVVIDLAKDKSND